MPRGHFSQSVYTPASPTHVRSRDRAGPRVPRRRRPHDPRDARALGPEAHAAGAVTQPPTYTNSRSLLVGAANCRATPSCGKAIWQLIQPDLIVLSRHEQSRRINEVEKALKRVGLDGSMGARVGVVWWREAALLGPIGFARATFKHADVLYADKSTASLDRANCQMVIDLIRQRANEGRPSSLRPMMTIWQRLRTQTLPWEVPQDSSHDISCGCASCPQHRTRCHLVLQEPANVWCRGSGCHPVAPGGTWWHALRLRSTWCRRVHGQGAARKAVGSQAP